MSALGDEFRSAREARGLTLSDVAEQIHIRSVYLNAIENEDWPSIGAPVYVRGFIRTYARFLGLESEAVVAKFNQTVPAERPVHAAASAAAAERDRSGPSLWAMLGVLVAVLLSAFVGWEWWSYAQGSAGRGATAAASPPSRTAPAGSQLRGAAAGSEVPAAGASPAPSSSPGTPPPALRHALAIRLTQRSWLRVVVDGKTQIEGIFPAGTERTFAGTVADVRVGNAGGVTVSLHGRPPATLGKDGDVVEQRFAL